MGADREQCVDIEFAEPGDPKIALVNETNCFNSSELGFADMFTIAAMNPATGLRFDDKKSYASSSRALSNWLPFVVAVGLAAIL